jgi:hypothetical protein
MSRSTSCNTAIGGNAQITFEPDEIVAAYLAELVKRTQRPQEDLINDILWQTLRQLIEDNDTDLLRAYMP